MLDIESKEYKIMIKEMIQGKEKVKTPWGTAKIDNTVGYYRITSSKEGNNRKSVHSLIWEECNNCKVPDGYVIHHINFNKLCNDIDNLQIMKDSEHKSLHNKGQNHPSSTYNYWNNNIVHYDKRDMFRNNEDGLKPKKTFRYKFNGWDLPIGCFNEFVSPEIIGELVEDAING